MENTIQDFFQTFLTISVAGLLIILFLISLYIIWLIKKGVKKAIVEVLTEYGITGYNSDKLNYEIRNSIALGVLSALEQYNNGNTNANNENND